MISDSYLRIITIIMLLLFVRTNSTMANPAFFPVPHLYLSLNIILLLFFRRLIIKSLDAYSIKQLCCNHIILAVTLNSFHTRRSSCTTDAVIL